MTPAAGNLCGLRAGPVGDLTRRPRACSSRYAARETRVRTAEFRRLDAVAVLTARLVQPPLTVGAAGPARGYPAGPALGSGWRGRRGQMGWRAPPLWALTAPVLGPRRPVPAR